MTSGGINGEATGGTGGDAGPTELLKEAAGGLLAGRHTPGVIAALVQGPNQAVHAAGRLSWARDEPVTTDTPFALGSVTKPFTALLLAVLAERGEVSYDDPVEAHLPAAAAPRRAPDPPVTLLDLATHSGGLPRRPRGLYRRGLPQWFTDPYGSYRISDLYRDTTRLRPRRSRTVRYSTYGMGLLGQLLANAAGTDYASLLAERVLRPLGMDATGIPGTPAPGGAARPATGHRRGRAVPAWTFDALAGAGALYSTGPDLLRFLHANVHPHLTTLAAPLSATHQPYHPWPRSPNDVSLGWYHRVARGRTLLWHTGGTGGFTAFVGFSPDAKAGAAVVANVTPTHAQPVVRAGRRLLRAVIF
ncbi:serine hydrolase domain-containing protein [Streptomyces sp. DSM 44917]|uniref:Serine hydrolase domain-containing protein n=1 Tax=Streptomyces boetiae TaxID=3075541 RepID=A0ABU2LBP1_9ACTN|nr:serine hydrolase domain-containing protein [Streptomyces sp. DSM 44917]MDT0309001.1 serine hydrolase domain-containing protein [Streptomyces sp. DSM 44917]